MDIAKGMDVSGVVAVFADSLIAEFPNNYSLSVTGKVNLQCFRKSAFLEKHRAEIRVGGKSIHANLLQVWCYVNGVDIRTAGLTRSKDINPLLEGIADYLSQYFTQFKWEANKPTSAKRERVSLDELFA